METLVRFISHYVEIVHILYLQTQDTVPHSFNAANALSSTLV